MKLASFTRKLKKIYQVGLRECVRIVVNRTTIKRFAKKHKQAAIEKKAATTWDVFIKTHPAFVLKQDRFFLNELAAHADQEDVIACANNVLQNNFFLFNQDVYFDGDARWHTDFLLQREGGIDCSFDPEVYFDDIVISAGKTQECVKDIRVVWEISRLQLLMPLGKAYALTNNKKYSDCFQALVSDWSYQNPYLLGVNWVCPMEVGIRAINLIVGGFYFKDAHINQIFWQSYVCLLYDHMQYLESTWEYYDGRTSNHYLSDLVGYFYLCVFFDKKHDWVVKEILSESEKQVASDGMSYEGSTAYHVLVTELFYLFSLLCDQAVVSLPKSFHQKLARMFDAIAACKVNERDMIMIGDNDSGKVLWTGLSPQVVEKMQTKQSQERTFFEQFGLTIIKKEGWHVSLRQHAYKFEQPSGHFHNDVGSITLAFNGVPILVDPGSYCYTASAFWRNYFRSASVHNAVSVKGKEPVEFDERLFALDLSEFDSSTIRFEKKEGVISSKYDNSGLRFKRIIQVQKKAVEITDIVSRSSPKVEGALLFFNFTFAPGIVLEKVEGGWLILQKKESLCILQTDLNFELKPGWVSYNYGSKIPVIRLCAEATFEKNREYICSFRLLNSMV